MSSDNSNSPRSYETPSLSTGVYLLLDKSKAAFPGSPLDLGPREQLALSQPDPTLSRSPVQVDLLLPDQGVVLCPQNSLPLEELFLWPFC